MIIRCGVPRTPRAKAQPAKKLILILQDQIPQPMGDLAFDHLRREIEGRPIEGLQTQRFPDLEQCRGVRLSGLV